MKNKALWILCSLMAMSAAAVADDIRLGEPSYGGTGCPAGTASVSLSPDSKALSILFDQYVVEAGRATGKRLERKSCNVAIPVHVPQGLSVSVFKVDYRGFNSLPAGANSEFNVEYFFAGSRGPLYSRKFYGPLDADYTLTNNLLATAQVWSPCGADVILRTNSSMRVNTNIRQEQTLATVDSADIEAGLIYHLQWRRCN
jgi:hypothetical protein